MHDFLHVKFHKTCFILYVVVFSEEYSGKLEENVYFTVERKVL